MSGTGILEFGSFCTPFMPAGTTAAPAVGKPVKKVEIIPTRDVKIGGSK